MNYQIHDFDDYSEFITRQLRNLRHFERCLFSVWCADRLLTSHADLLSVNMPNSDLRILQEIVNELWDTLLGGVIPEKDQLNALDMDFMAIDDGWADPTKDIHPVVPIVQQGVGLCILSCRRNDSGLVKIIAQAVIDSLECTLEEDEPNYLPDILFEYPQIQNEAEAQLDIIKYLKGEYELIPELRMMFG